MLSALNNQHPLSSVRLQAPLPLSDQVFQDQGTVQGESHILGEWLASSPGDTHQRDKHLLCHNRNRFAFLQDNPLVRNPCGTVVLRAVHIETHST